MKQMRYMFILMLFQFFLAGCSDEEEMIIPAPEISGIEEEYTIPEGYQLVLSPIVANNEQASYRWLLDGNEVGNTLSYTFSSELPGRFKLVLEVTNEGGKVQKEVTITVTAKVSDPEVTYVETKVYTLVELASPEYLSEINQVQWEVIRTIPFIVRGDQNAAIRGSKRRSIHAKRHWWGNNWRSSGHSGEKGTTTFSLYREGV